MGFPDLTRIVNDVQRSNLKYKDICESAVIDYYKKLGQAQVLKEATGKPEEIIDEAEQAAASDEANAEAPESTEADAEDMGEYVPDDAEEITDNEAEALEADVTSEEALVADEAVDGTEESAEEAKVEEAPASKPLSKLNKNELLAKCSELGVADKVEKSMTNAQLVELIKSA